MLVIAFIHDNTEVFHNHDYSYYTNSPNNMKYARENGAWVNYDSIIDGLYWNYWQEQYHLWIKIAKYFGIIAYLVALPFFNNLFVKQISLPEKS